MTNPRLGFRLALVLALLGLGALLPGASGDPGDLHCLRFPSSADVYVPGYGNVCAYYGNGCIDCWSECDGGQPCGGGPCTGLGCLDQQPF